MLTDDQNLCMEICINVNEEDNVYYTFPKDYTTSIITNEELITPTINIGETANSIEDSLVKPSSTVADCLNHIIEDDNVLYESCGNDTSLSKLWQVTSSDFLFMPCEFESVKDSAFEENENTAYQPSTNIVEKSQLTTYSCNICSDVFNELLACLLHYENVHKLFKCSLCDKSFRRRYSLTSHLLVHSSKRDFVCSICDFKFKRQNDLRSHVKRLHTLKEEDDEIFNCDKCSYQTKTKQLISSHVLLHIGVSSYMCDVCGKQCKSNAQVTDHRNRHLGIKPYHCDLCNSYFACKQSLLVHQRAQHEDVYSYQCDVCGRLFSYKTGLDCHIKLHKGENRVKCDLCSKEVSCKSALLNHKKTHSGVREFACGICGKMYINKNSLQDHLFVHTGSKPFQCLLCDKSFTMRKKLLNHERIHDQLRALHRCTQCDKSYLSKFRLKMHLFDKHQMNLV